MNKLFCITLLILALLLVPFIPAYATTPGQTTSEGSGQITGEPDRQTTGENSNIFTSMASKLISFQNSLVLEGQRVKNVLLIGQDGVIAGEVQDEVVVINGNLTLKNTARVADRVFIIGGVLQQEPGAQVGKGVFNVSTSKAFVNSLLLGVMAFIGLELAKFLISISVIVAAIIVMFTTPTIARNSATVLKKGLLKSAVLGFLALLCFGLLAGALVTTILGIPLALILILILTLMLIVGFTGTALIFGELLKPSPDSLLRPTLPSTLLTTTIGSLMLVALANLPVVGVVWVLIILVLALGSFIQVIFNKQVSPSGGN